MKDNNKTPDFAPEPASECASPLAEGSAVDASCPDEQDFMSQAQPPADPKETEMQMIKKENERLKEENTGLKDARLRGLAEFDNYKRRIARESVRLTEAANESLIKELIPVLENFERALDPAHKEKDVEAFYKGVTLIYNLFNDKLKKAGLTEYNPMGELFDSEKHEAVMQIASGDVPEHQIAQVLQKGYLLNNKIVQYAKVAVSKGNN
ncbi:MAG: nucleotide exchange factor GrpE [Fibrobacterota bacterium]